MTSAKAAAPEVINSHSIGSRVNRGFMQPTIACGAGPGRHADPDGRLLPSRAGHRPGAAAGRPPLPSRPYGHTDAADTARAPSARRHRRQRTTAAVSGGPPPRRRRLGRRGSDAAAGGEAVQQAHPLVQELKDSTAKDSMTRWPNGSRRVPAGRAGGDVGATGRQSAARRPGASPGADLGRASAAGADPHRLKARALAASGALPGQRDVG
jgi:hypothetical protein